MWRYLLILFYLGVCAPAYALECFELDEQEEKWYLASDFTKANIGLTLESGAIQARRDNKVISEVKVPTEIDDLAICPVGESLQNIAFIIKIRHVQAYCAGTTYEHYYAWLKSEKLIHLISSASAGDSDGYNSYFHSESVFFPANGLPYNTVLKVVGNTETNTQFDRDENDEVIELGTDEQWAYASLFYRWDGEKLTPVKQDVRALQDHYTGQNTELDE